MNLFYQKNLSLYFIGLLIFGLTLSFNFNVRAVGQIFACQTLEEKDNLGRITQITCIFGDDLDENYVDEKIKGRNAKVSCRYRQEDSRAKISHIPNTEFYCTGEGFRSWDKRDKEVKDKAGYLQNQLNDGKEYWVQCDTTNTSINPLDIIGYNLSNDEYPAQEIIKWGTWLDGLDELESIYYKTGSRIRPDEANPRCESCSSNLITSCSKWKPVTNVSTCQIPTATNSVLPTKCTFGANSSTNCAASVSKVEGTDRRFIGSNTYFCNGNNDVFECPGKLQNETYDQIFEKTTDYIQLKNTSCRKTTGLATGVCKLRTPPLPDTFCDFGPFKTGSGNSCAEKISSPINPATDVGVFTENGKFIYCSPKKRKIECDKKFTYKEIFEPKSELDANNNYIDNYEGKDIATSKKSECREISINSSLTCNVSTTKFLNGETTCEVPYACSQDPNVPTVTIPGSNKYGSIYCISSISQPLKGSMIFCEGTRDYDSITDEKIVNGQTGIYLNEYGKQLCASFEVELRYLNPLSPLGLIKTVSTTLYYFAIFYFIVLILINAFSYVRSGEDPSKLKQITESLFNTIAGFIFVLASGGVIVYLINSINP